MGVAQPDGEHDYSAHLVEQADAALCEAKPCGRNSVMVAQSTLECAPGVVPRHL